METLLVQWEKSLRQNVRAVVLQGTAGVTFQKGTILCYDRDYGTATERDGTRDHRVEAPSNTNNNWVAGVLAHNVTIPDEGSIAVKIWEPGNMALVAIFDAVTLGDFLTGQTVSGRFGTYGFGGRGTGQALETIAAVTGPTDYSSKPISKSIDGSATFTASTNTVTKTAAFANVPATANLTGEEYVHIVGGSTDNPGAAAGIAPTPGRYKIVSKTSDDAVVVEGTPAASNVDIAFYCYRGNPLALAILDDGPESGLVEIVSPITDGSGTTAVTLMKLGETRLFGGFDLDNGDAIFTVADGTKLGQRKSIVLLAAITTNDVQISVVGEQLDGTTDLAGLEFDGASDRSIIEWMGTGWKLIWNAGPTIS